MIGGESTERDSSHPPLSTRLSTGLTRFVDRWQPLRDSLGCAAARSRVGRVATSLRSAVVHSRLVQWLTREPDPAVVVIDLAETRTVGPILRVLDAIAGFVGRTVGRSGVAGRVAKAARAVERNAVPIVSAALLGFVAGTLVLTWQGAEPLWLLALSIAGVAGLLGLGVDRSPRVLAESSAVRWLTALLAPPADRSEGTR